MKSKAFIIEFQKPLDFVQTYRSLLRNNRFVLRTKISLNLGERVKVRFNTPDGNGVMIRCKVATQIDDQSWGITLPKSEDVRWLQEKALDMEKSLGVSAARAKELGQESDLHGDPKATRPGPSRDKARQTSSTPQIPLQPTPRGSQSSVGPITVEIAPQAAGANFNMPQAELLDPEQDGFPSLKDTGLDLLNEQGAVATEPLVSPASQQTLQDLAVTQVVRGRGTGEMDIPPLTDSRGDAGIDFPQGIKRPSLDAIKRLHGMSLTQKKQLAISGNATERMVLFQDNDRSIQLWVLKNPQITEVEIRWLSSMTTLSVDAVGFLVGNRKWSSIPEIATNLLSNPITATDAIQRLLTILPTQVLLTLHQKPGVRPMVADMSRKMLMERGEI